MMREDRRFPAPYRRHSRDGYLCAGLIAVLVMFLLVIPVDRARAEKAEDDKPYPPSWHFSGFYLGAFAGHFNPSLHARQNGAALKTMPKNGEGGVTFGYGLRLGNHTILAIEGEFAFTNIIDRQRLLDDKLLDPLIDAIVPDATGSLGARIGYAVTDRLLIYGRAGWANMAFGSDENASFNGVRFGGGMEWRIWKGLALRLELIHDEYQRKRFKEGLSLRPSATSFRGGLTIHF